jgi:NADH:ubiquinone oxidoreductase subunit 3 (subunit A)
LNRQGGRHVYEKLEETVELGFRVLIVSFFVAARLFIVVEAFVSLRLAIEELYQTVEWSKFIPYLQFFIFIFIFISKNQNQDE